MKPYFLMLLIGTIAAFSDLVERGNGARRKRGRVPFISAVIRRIGRTRSQASRP